MLEKAPHIEGLNSSYDHVLPSEGINPFEVHAEFSVVAVEKPFKSNEAKRLITENQVFVTYTWELGHSVIMRPINDDVRYDEKLEKWVVDRLAGEKHTDIGRHPEAWNNFYRGTFDKVIGTPIDSIFKNDPSTAMYLKSMRIDTVERLAELPYQEVQLLGASGHEFVKRAKEYIARANGMAESSKDAERFEAIAKENEALQAKIDEMQAQMLSLLDAKLAEDDPKKAVKKK